MPSLRMAAGFLAALALATVAHGQWTVVGLHPTGADYSAAFGVGGERQAGEIDTGGTGHAVLWSGSNLSWIDMNPAGADSSVAFGLSGNQQAGGTGIAGVGHASLWTGTAASWVDLNPAGADYSTADGVGDGQQVGYAHVGALDLASLWTGTAASWVNLNPSVADYSEALGAGGGQQVGYAEIGGVYHASLWTGTAASWVDLKPPGTGFTTAFAAAGGQQVGEVGLSGAPHASLWSGTAASWVDLNPASADYSQAGAAFPGLQAGYAYVNLVHGASLWSGSATSWINLHAFVPARFGSSDADGVWRDSNGVIYVVGSGQDSTSGATEALMWISNAVAPMSFSIYRGALASGGVSDLVTSDDSRLIVRNGFTLSSQESPITLRIDTVAQFATVSDLKVTLEAQVNTAGLGQSIDLFDYTLNDWVTVDTRAAHVNAGSAATITVPNPNRFIQPGTKAMRAQIRYRQTGFVLSASWQAKIDQLQWELSGA